jgi:hypothetical protein
MPLAKYNTGSAGMSHLYSCTGQFVYFSFADKIAAELTYYPVGIGMIPADVRDVKGAYHGYAKAAQFPLAVGASAMRRKISSVSPSNARA